MQRARVSFSRHLLVDGSNVMNAWPELRAALKRDRDAARGLLVRLLTPIHDAEGVRVTVVFDGRGPELSLEHPAAEHTLSVIHTPAGTTADDVIEQLVANATDASACVVASDDRAERETVSASGAAPISSADLLAWVARATSRQTRHVDEVKDKSRRGWSGSP